MLTCMLLCGTNVGRQCACKVETKYKFVLSHIIRVRRLILLLSIQLVLMKLLVYNQIEAMFLRQNVQNEM